MGPEVDDDREPWWLVTSVFDPDGTGSDFAYTEGLAAVGEPELHLWARPTRGDDPGLDWKLSPRDCCLILNQLAWRLLDGRLSVGDSWTEEYDEGFVTAHFSIGAPVDAASVDAFGAGDAPVLPISWSLRRPPVGPPRPMDPAARAAAESTYAQDVLMVGSEPRPVPPGWELPRKPRWDCDERFGPRTPSVLGKAARLWIATPVQWRDVVDYVVTAANQRLPISYARAVALSAAREVGRVTALERLILEVGAAVDEFSREAGSEIWGSLRDQYCHGLEDAEAGHAWSEVSTEVKDALATFLVVEAAADLLPDRVVRLGQGVVLAALTPAGLAPDTRWQCGPVVDRAVSELVADTRVSALVEAAAAWDEIYWREGGAGFAILTWTSAGCSRPIFVVLDADRCDVASDLLRARGLGLGTLQVWLTSLATVLAERVSIDQSVVDEFLRAGRAVPGLKELVNTPLPPEAA